MTELPLPRRGYYGTFEDHRDPPRIGIMTLSDDVSYVPIVDLQVVTA